jgi:AraC-like DNA-binding protein
MRKKKKFLPHLMISEVTVPPAEEWTPQFPGWTLVLLSSGSGYWMNSKGVLELTTGVVLVLSPQSKGSIRASQIGRIMMQQFYLAPERLTGLLSLVEQNCLLHAAEQQQFSVRFFPPTDSVSSKFQQLTQGKPANHFAQRLALIQLFNDALGKELKFPAGKPSPNPDAKGRLQELLEQMPASELINLSLPELARKAQCTPRHLGRLFREELGMSFREKQSQIRLERACELLATTESKMVDVALESGYQSLSLFNLIFKRSYGVSPGKWRSSNQVTAA